MNLSSSSSLRAPFAPSGRSTLDASSFPGRWASGLEALGRPASRALVWREATSLLGIVVALALAVLV